MGNKKEMILDILRTPSKEECFKGTEWIAYVIGDMAHIGQYRDNDRPYFEHPKRCNEMFHNLVCLGGWYKKSILKKHDIPSYGIPELAYLHDVIEDTELTIKDVKDIFYEMGYREFFDKYIRIPLKLITHNKKEDYDSYIDKVMSNPISAFTKMLDLADNMNLFGLGHLGWEEIERANRYAGYFKRINDKYHYLEKLKECFKDMQDAWDE